MKILLVQTGFIGDMILSTPVISALKKLYPNSQLDLLTTPLSAPLFAADSRLENVLVFDKRGADSGMLGLLRMSKRLRLEKYSTVFSLHKSFRTAFLLALSAIPKRYGFKEASLPFLYSKTAIRNDLPHDALRNTAILRTVGSDPLELDEPLSLYPSKEAKSAAAALLKKRAGVSYVGIAPGSVWLTKRWTEEGFASTVDLLLEQGITPVLIGGPADTELAEKILSLSTSEKKSEVINCCGKLAIDQSVALIEMLDVLVSNDSSPLHMASACQTPVVALFCATIPEFGYGPWKVPNRVLGVEGLSCRPCGRHGGQSCPTGTHACRKDLQATEVFEAVRSLLSQRVEVSEVQGKGI